MTVLPSASSSGWRSERSYDTCRSVRTGAAKVKVRGRKSSSIIESTSAVVPTFRNVETSERLASPTMTCSRRYFWASQCGSSRVLTMGRFNVVSRPTSSSKKSARWVSWKATSEAPGASEPTLPAPVKIWRVMKCGITWLTMRENGTARSMR